MIGQILYGFGSNQAANTPDAPAIASIIDDGNPDSVTVTVTGSDTIQLYYRERFASDWVTGLTRVGSGEIVQDGLTVGRWYEMFATAKADGLESAPSNIEVVYLGAECDTIEEAVYTILTGDGPVNSLISNRIFPKILPQKESVPALTYQQITGKHDYTMDGKDDLKETRLQINCWAGKYSQTKQLTITVEDALDDFSGIVGTIKIQTVQLENTGDMPDVSSLKGIKRYGKRLDFKIWYKKQ